MDPHILTLLLISLVTGIAGGLVSYYGLMNNRGSAAAAKPGAKDAANDPDDTSPVPPMIRGVAAAFVTPLFLAALSSDLLKVDADAGVQQLRYLLYAATSLLAAISSRAFINNVSQRVLNEARQAGASAGEKAAREETEPLKADAAENRAAIESNRSDIDVLAVAQSKPEMLGGPPAKAVTSTASASRAMSRGTSWSSDPNKGAFGGQRAHGEWRLDATVVPRGNSTTFFDVELRVSGPTSAAGRDVEFHLHPTFSPQVQTVQLDDNGVAELDLISMGAFTVGVRADNGNVELELDLADIDDAPNEFRER